MKTTKLKFATRTLLDSAAPQWSKVTPEPILLGGAPLHHQPSRYIRAAWAGKPIGAVRDLKVQAAHNGENVFFRLEWADPTEDRDYGDGSKFPDAAGVVFPLNGRARLETMGTPESPVNAWYWRANLADGEAEHLISTGLGVFKAFGKANVNARSQWQDDQWSVVLSRPMTSKGGGVRMLGRKSVSVGFCVWDGSSQERAGLMSFSKTWRELTIE